MTLTSEDCCAAWPEIRPHLKWFQFADEPGVFAMPCILDTSWRVNYCPTCGEKRRSAIWNTNTHPTRQEDFDA
jgi:hypothetical protein